jgi:hypothetical protein
MRWAGQVVCTGKRDKDRIWWRNPKERDRLEKLDIFGRIILNNLQ